MNVKLSPIKQFRLLADQLEETVSLGQGTPHFETPNSIAEAAIAAIKNHKVDWYGDPRGLEELRQEISKLIKKEDEIDYAPGNEVLITPGALAGLNIFFMAMLKQGDEVIMLTPTYYPFLKMPNLVGAKAKTFPYIDTTKGWILNRELLKSSINNNTKAILLCIPNNPTGTILTKDDLEFISKLVIENNLYLLTDEVYKYFTYDQKYLSFSNLANLKERWIRFNSFSKAWSMSGWRIGYTLASKKVMEKMLPVSDLIFTASSSLVSQYGALAALKQNGNVPYKFKETLLENRNIVAGFLDNMSDDFSYHMPKSGFYFLVKLNNYKNDYEFATKILYETGVVVIPGSTFGEAGKGYIRISFSPSRLEIIKGLERIQTYLTDQKKVSSLLKYSSNMRK